jgi:hypothetical protein
MKKLLLLLAINSFSFSSIAMGFPHNTCEQQRILSKNIKQKSLINKLEKSIKVNVERISSVKEDTSVKSFVEMLTDYLVKFFTEKILGKRLTEFKIMQEAKVEYLVLKQDFEFYLIV